MGKWMLYASMTWIMLHFIKYSKSDTNTTKEKPATTFSQLALYRKFFKQKRAEQMVAVERILTMGDYARQYKVVNIIFEKLFNVIHDSKAQVAVSGYIPGEEFPVEQKYREAIGNIVENTAFFGDIVLRVPDISHKVFNQNKDWKLLALWSISFTNSTTIYDEMDSKLIKLMAQELRLVPREPDYFNPFTEEYKSLKDMLKEEEEGKKLPKQKKNGKKGKTKGPKLSRVDL